MFSMLCRRYIVGLLTMCGKSLKIYLNVRQQQRRPTLKALRRARADAGLTISELARRAGVSRDTISNAERGLHSLQATTLHKVAQALGKAPSELLAEEEKLAPKVESRSPSEPSLFNDLEHERALRYLGAWREFVWKLQEEWKEEPPKTSRDIAPLFNAMTALVEQGVFELSKASSGTEHIELTLFMEGLKWLNAIADKVEADEEAEKRRAVLRVVEDQVGA